jgi:hypothetical protein
VSPLSWPVLTGTLLVWSPALWAARVDGTLSFDVALQRLLVCAVGVWVAVSLVGELAQWAVRANAVPDEDASDDPEPG